MSDQKYLPLPNKYTRWYNMLVSSRQALNRRFKVGCGYEKHHIVPRSLGGPNGKDNLVVLTPREHCLAHMLLSRMFVGESKAKMCYALMSLAAFRNKNRMVLPTREYDRLRRAYTAALMDPDYRAWRSAQTAKQWTPARRESVSRKAKEQWKNGKHEYHRSDEWRERKRNDTSRHWKDPEYQQRQSEKAKRMWAEDGVLRRLRPRPD